MRLQDKEKKILDFLRGQKLTVIATSSRDSFSESALIAFAETDDLFVYFQTGKHTRKAQNLSMNPHVSFVFGLELKDMMTVQYEGIAEPVRDREEIDYCRKLFRQKDSPTTDEYLEHPSAVLFKVRPTWIGCSDYSGTKPLVIELTNFVNSPSFI